KPFLRCTETTYPCQVNSLRDTHTHTLGCPSHTLSATFSSPPRHVSARRNRGHTHTHTHTHSHTQTYTLLFEFPQKNQITYPNCITLCVYVSAAVCLCQTLCCGRD